MASVDDGYEFSNYICSLMVPVCVILREVKQTFIYRVIPSLIWGRISVPSQFKNEQKLAKMVYIIPNFLVLHFGGNFMKIEAKIAKLQIHENLHKNVNENMFSFTFLYKFS